MDSSDFDIDQMLVNAAESGDMERVQSALAGGAKASSFALAWAAKGGHDDIVALLLDRGADLHAEDDFALRWSAMEGNTATVELLVQHGANIHAGNDEALCQMVQQGHNDLVVFLLDRGADLHVGGNLLLCLAITHGKKETALLLLRRGVGPEMSDPVSAEELKAWLRKLKPETAQKFVSGDWRQQCFVAGDQGKRILHDDILDACVTGQFASLVVTPLIASSQRADRQLFQDIWDALPEHWQSQHQNLYMQFAKAGGLAPAIGAYSTAAQNGRADPVQGARR